MHLVVESLWDGTPATAAERVTLDLRAVAGALEITVDAPFHRDPAPSSPPGPTPGLWHYEVVELFLFAFEDRYLEIELGPHGHWLGLQLHGIRRILDIPVTLTYACERRGDRWYGRALVPAAALPPGIARWNAHAIHGQDIARRYLSALPAGGPDPDFHRPDVSAALDPALLQALSSGT